MARSPFLISPGDVLKLLPLSDLHLTAKPSATELLLSNREYLQRMDYVILLGDQCACYGTDTEYSALDACLPRLPKPYIAVNGNHEFYFEVHDEFSGHYGKIWREQSVEDKARQLRKFRDFFGLETLWHVAHHALATCIFLGLDDIENHKVESLSAAQLEFLAAELRAAQSQPVFIFCHAPLMLRHRLDMAYYDDERTACVEIAGELRELMEQRKLPLFWVAGHIHLRPDHHLFSAYNIGPHIWQVHCPDSWGYSRWSREHLKPQRHGQLFSRHLEIRQNEVALVTHDHIQRADIARQTITWEG
ncbi:MAG TPA: metallophosphoesterase [Abditibacteriaceae bacterium]|nr:metallophosphoesterase [Abditibacteriaceae bacterium]